MSHPIIAEVILHTRTYIIISMSVFTIKADGPINQSLGVGVNDCRTCSYICVEALAKFKLLVSFLAHNFLGTKVFFFVCNSLFLYDMLFLRLKGNRLTDEQTDKTNTITLAVHTHKGE